MKRYLHLFSQHSIYNLNKNSLLKPNVSYCQEEDHLHYNPIDYSKEYLTTIAREDGTISFNILKSMGTDLITSISYSIDDGATWTTIQNQNNKSANLQITVNVNEGDKILWKGDAQQTGYFDESAGENIGSFFSSTCEFDVAGNVMSLLYSDNFKGEVTLDKDDQFASLFSDSEGNVDCKVVNAKNLSLLATTLVSGCYCSMFYGCTSLVNAPQLPATTLADFCYYTMFNGCTSLVNAPELPATTLVDSCYYSMFEGCTSLINAPSVLPATTLVNECYYSMFKGCTSLVNAPVLYATTLARSCCYEMFYGCTSLVNVPALSATTLVIYCCKGMFGNCTSLVTAPELPATTLANSCYYEMFKGCTSLTVAPELPATTLANSCYAYMFKGCTSLVTAPELPAITLVDYCYKGMFFGCTNLNYIKAMFTTTPSPTYTNGWVRNVASNGTFVKNSAATWNVSGVNGVPSGWTVETANE